MALEKGSYYVSSLVRKLQSSSVSSVQKALISLSRATKRSENVAKLRVEGGIKTLLQFIQTSNRKTVDMAVSVLANCALEKESRTEIKDLGGLRHLANLLHSLNETSVLGRVARAFANLSVDPATAPEIRNLDVVQKLVNLLKGTADLHFQLNVIRALRVIGKTDIGKKEIVECNGLQFIIELLHSENKEIKTSCLQSLQELSRSGNRRVAEQIQDHYAIEAVISMTYSDDEDLRENAVLTLSNITTNASVRVSVGTIGGIEAFIHQIQRRACRSLVLRSVEGVSMCCREAVNRNKVRLCGGLEVLLDVLRCAEYSQAHDRILGAFVCFSYDELALNCLIGNGIVTTLISFLRKLLFPKTAARCKEVSEKTNCMSTSAHEDSRAHSCKPVAVPKKDSTISPLSKTTTKPTQSESRVGTTFESKIERSLWIDVSHTTALSPATSISPSCSPDLRLSYMSPGSPYSVLEGAFSPMVYSPSGSEDDDDSSSEDSLSEKTFEDGVDLLETKCAMKPSFLEIVSSSEGMTTKSQTVTTMAGNMVTKSETMLAISTNKAITSDGVTSSEDIMTSMDMTITRDMKSHSAEIKDQDGYGFEIATMTSHSPQLSSTIPKPMLLPGTPASDHLYMFLPKENLFSADQPSSKKSDSRTMSRSHQARRSSTQTTPSIGMDGHQTNLTSPVRSSPSSSSSYSGELDGPEKKIMFLLSRFGQMPHPTEALISPSTTQTLLDYLSYSDNPDPRCMRLLHRLTSDVNFFEKLVLHMLPGAIYRQLGCGYGPGYHLDNDGEATSYESSLETPQEDVLTSKVTEATLVSREECATEKQYVSFSTTRTKELGESLLSSLTTQASTAFGEGQLVHLLLRGSPRQKRACALSLPYLCRPMRVKRKLLLQYNGILTILSALSDPVEDDDVVRAIESLTFLLSNSSSALPSQPSSRKFFIGKSTVGLCENTKRTAEGTPMNVSVTFSAKRRKIEDGSKSVDTKDTSEALALPKNQKAEELFDLRLEKRKLDTKCCYGEVKETPYDVVLKLDDCRSVKAHRFVLSSISNVFAAMLSSDYIEGNQLEVTVKDVDYAVLLFIVHYAYGCTWSFESHSENPESPCSVLKTDSKNHSRTKLRTDSENFSCAMLDADSKNPCKVFETCLRSDDALNFDFLLDLIACSDRFLLDDLKHQCEQVMFCSVNEHHVVDMYLCGACYNAPVLRDFSLKYIFRRNLRCVYQCMVRLLESQESMCVTEDIKRIALLCL